MNETDPFLFDLQMACLASIIFHLLHNKNVHFMCSFIDFILIDVDSEKYQSIRMNHGVVWHEMLQKYQLQLDQILIQLLG